LLFGVKTHRLIQVFLRKERAKMRVKQERPRYSARSSDRIQCVIDKLRQGRLVKFATFVRDHITLIKMYFRPIDDKTTYATQAAHNPGSSSSGAGSTDTGNTGPGSTGIPKKADATSLQGSTGGYWKAVYVQGIPLIITLLMGGILVFSVLCRLVTNYCVHCTSNFKDCLIRNELEMPVIPFFASVQD
jgi:hypothetical protein